MKTNIRQIQRLFLLAVAVAALSCAAFAASCGGAAQDRKGWYVAELNGAPGLWHDGKPVPPIMFWQWQLQEQDVKSMSAAGIELFATMGSFPHYEHPYWRADGTFDTGYYDGQFDALLEWNPSAQVLPRIFATAPDWWSELNTNEQFAAEVPVGVDVSTWHLPRESLASERARKEVSPYYRRLVRHLFERYGGNLLGVHVANGPWGENFSWDAYYRKRFRPVAGDQSEPMCRAFVRYLRGKYGNDENRLRDAFKDPSVTFESVKVPTKAERLRVNADGWRDPAEGRKVLDYFECHNLVTVDMLDYWCSIVKEETGGKLPTLVFYGYTQDERWPVECDHRAIAALYGRPSVDMLSAPHTYHRRDLGGDGEMRQYLASAALHGKLFVDEGDDMPHLEMLKPKPDHRAHAKTIDDSLALLYREFGNTVTHGVGLWYMDLKKETFRDPRLYDACGRMRKWSLESLKHDRSHISEVAVVSSVESEFYLPYREQEGKDDRNPCTRLYLEQMGEFYRAGAPFDWYLVEDIDAVLSRNYKTVVFLDCQYLTDEHYSKIMQLKGNGRSLVWFHAPGYASQTGLSASRMKTLCGFDYGTTNIVAQDFGNYYGVFSPGAGLSSSRLRDIYRRSGVHIYTDSDVVLSCNRSWLMLHTAQGTNCTVRLPEKVSRVFEITTETPVAENADTFTWKLPDRSTAIFLLESHNSKAKEGAAK